MNIPNIESKAKLFVFIGLAIISLVLYYHYSESEAKRQKAGEYIAIQIPYNQILKASNDSLEQINQVLDSLNRQSELLSYEMNNVKGSYRNQIRYKIVSLNRDFNSAIKQSRLIQGTSQNRIKQYEPEYELKKTAYEISEKDFAYNATTRFWMLILGIIIFILGMMTWSEKDKFEKEILLRQNIDKPTFSNNCQSCGKNFNSIIKYGTELNGVNNFHFCISCYQNGHFTNPDITLNEFIIGIKQELKGKGISEKMQKKVEKRIVDLDRWRVNQY